MSLYLFFPDLLALGLLLGRSPFTKRFYCCVVGQITFYKKGFIAVLLILIAAGQFLYSVCVKCFALLSGATAEPVMFNLLLPHWGEEGDVQVLLPHWGEEGDVQVGRGVSSFHQWYAVYQDLFSDPFKGGYRF